MQFRGFCSLLAMGLCCLPLAPPVLAASPEPPAQGVPDQPARRPKIGLALGGGGARGTAHIGVIRMLEQLHIPIDYVAGTSMGSVIGGLYACGYTPDQMEKLIATIPWDTLFRDAPARPDQSFRQKEDDFDHLIPFEFGVNLKKGGLLLPPGLIAGSKLGFVLESATLPCSSVASFDQLRIPFRAVATDIQTGQPYVMSKGNLARVIRASMAIPAIFTPVEIDGHMLIDGGESENLPVQTVKAMGADIVIAVNVGSSGAETAAKPTNVGGMIGRLIDLPLQQNTMASAKLATIVITPDLDGYTSADFVKGLKMIPLGYQAAEKDKGRLAEWSAPESVYGPWKTHHDATLPPLPNIDEIVVEPVPGIDQRRLEYQVHSKPGPLDTKILGQDLKRLYALGAFEIVSYSIVEDGNRRILKITATPKSWGPTYLKVGIFLGTDFQDTTQFDVTGLLDATEMNALGGEWKTTLSVGSPMDLRTRFFQPLTYRSHLFLSPYAAWQQESREVFADEVALGTYEVSRTALGMDLGYDFGTWGELRVGYARGFGKGERKVGDPEFPNLDWDEGGLTARMEVDQLDNVNLPHSGYFARADYIGNRTGLGATSSYDQLFAVGTGVKTIGRWTGLMKVEGGTGLGTNIPFYDEYRLGGLFRLSGRPIGQLTGNTYALAALLLYYRLTGAQGAIIKNVSAGVSLEGGNTWAYQAPVSWSGMKTAGSVYLVADTLIGPFFIGYGRSGSKNSSAYLYLNRSF
ncbi:MAG TPA: patatin-like phospholipase family protein [Thermoanaerobaculia bacterium]|jgi:NTE family protein|nr:patatin-like phospholipase family protein [Thermoanaerobaculia bacterium]